MDTIPPARQAQGPGPHGRICPGATNWRTDPAALCAAIEDALDARIRKTSHPGQESW